MHAIRSTAVSLALGAIAVAPLPATAGPTRIHVDGARGRDGAPGTSARPVRTLSAALALLHEPLVESVTIEIAGGAVHATTGGVAMPDGVLELALRMRPGVEVALVGRDGDAPVVLGWEGGRAMIDVREGAWRLENLQVGTFTTRQRRGVMVTGPATATLRDVTFRTRSHSDAAIWAERGAHVSLRGRIHVNEHLHDAADDETFAGIVATEHAVVKFDERDGAELDLGNGSLSASYYGCVRLGCATARITSWTKSNPFAIANGGRIDLHDTDTTLCAKRKDNTPIGPEHDGHILAEDAHITLVGANDCAITLQKASTFTCNDIELSGEFRKTLWAMSGSMFVGRFLSDVRQIEAHTGAQVHVEGVRGEVLGPVLVTSGGVVSLPGGRVEAALGDRAPR